MYLDFLGKIRAYRRILGVGLLLMGLLAFWWGRPRLVTLQGQFLGVPYQVQYMERWGRRSHQAGVEALLAELALAVTDELAQFNAHDCSDFAFATPFLYELLTKSKVAHQQTQGAFDPTVLPLLRAWEGMAPDRERLRGLRDGVCLDYVVANAQRGKKLKEGVQLDFGGLLRGYAADVVMGFLQTQGVQQLQVLLGGRAVAYGWPDALPVHAYVTPLAATPWQIVLAPWTEGGGAVAVANADGEGLTVDPATGCPAQSRLQAAVVLAAEGALADAYATAMVARGLDFARTLAEQQGMAVLLVCEGEDGAPAFYASPRLRMLQEQEHLIRVGVLTTNP